MAEATEQERTRFRDALRHREFRFLLGSDAISWTGDWCYSIAITVWVVQQTGSTAWVAAVFVLRLLPYVLFGAPGGVLADRLDRRKLLVGLDVGRGLVMLVLVGVVTADGPVLAGAVLCALSSSLSAVARPAVVAATPRVVGEDDLAAANAIETVIAQLTVFAGPALATLLIEIASIEVALLFNAVTFAVSAVLLTGVRSAGGGRADRAAAVASNREPADGDVEADGGAPEPAGVIAELKVGWEAIRAINGMVAFTFLLAGTLFAWGAEDVLRVLVATDNLGTGAQGIGLLGAATGIGGLLIAPFMARLIGRAHLAPLLTLSLVLTGGALALLAIPRSIGPALVVAGLAGIALILVEVAALTLVQRSVAPEVLGRVYGLQDSLNAGATLLGTIAVPFLVAWIGLDASLVLIGTALVVGAIVALPRMRPLDEHAAKRARQLAPAVEVLAGVAMFEDAPRPVLERIAGVHREERVAAGTTVMHLGDEPDDLYVVRTGTFDVLRSDELDAADSRVTELGPGDVFGEIGLVRRVPRTASVVATSDAVVWRIPGAVFVDAFSGGGVLPGAITATIAARLAGLGRAAPPVVSGPPGAR
jgi:MFS family permease